MKPVVFPLATGVLVLVTWLAVTAVEQCLLTSTDPKFDCRSSLMFVFAFGSIAAVLSGIAAALARALLHRYLRFASVVPELLAAGLTSLVLVLMFAAVIYWEVSSGNIAGNFMTWLGMSLVGSGISLVIVKRFIKPS